MKKVTGHGVKRDVFFGHFETIDSNTYLTIAVTFICKETRDGIRIASVNTETIAGFGGVDNYFSFRKSLDGLRDGGGIGDVNNLHASILTGER